MARSLFLLSVAMMSFTATRVFGIPLGLAMSVVATSAVVGSNLLRATTASKNETIRQMLAWHPWWISAVLILAGGLLSATNAMNVANHLREMLQATWTLSIAASITMYAARKWRASVLHALLLGVCVDSLITIWDGLSRMGLGPLIAGLSVGKGGFATPSGFNPASELFTGRYEGVMTHPNELGEITAVCFPIALAFFLEAIARKRILIATIFILFAASMLWANLLSGSVSGFLGIGLAAGCVLFGWFCQRVSYQRLSMLALGLSVAVLALLLVSIIGNGKALVSAVGTWITPSLNRALDISGPLRVGLNRRALALALASPISGYGMDIESLHAGLTETYVVHNAFLRSWLGGGIFALLASLWAYFCAARLSLESMVGFFRRKATLLEFALASSIVGWVAIDMTSPTSFLSYTMITAFFLYGVREKTRRSHLGDAAAKPIRWPESQQGYS